MPDPLRLYRNSSRCLIDVAEVDTGTLASAPRSMTHFSAGTCARGSNARFSHELDETNVLADRQKRSGFPVGFPLQQSSTPPKAKPHQAVQSGMPRASSLQALDLFDQRPASLHRTQTEQVVRHRRWHSGPERLSKISHERSSRRWQILVCCIVLSFSAVICGKTIYDSVKQGADKPRPSDLSTALRFPCDSMWHFFPTAEGGCETLRPSVESSRFSNETPIFYLTRNTSKSWKASTRTLIPKMRHMSKVSSWPKHVPLPRVLPGSPQLDRNHPVLLHISALLRARDHIALHRGPQHALIMDDTVLPVSRYVDSSDGQRPAVFDQLDTAISALPASWSVLQLAVSDPSTPLWSWDAIRSEWMLAGRPSVAASPAAIGLPHFGGAVAYVVHLRGIRSILSRLGESYGALSWQQITSRCPADGSQPVLDCLLYNGISGVFTATPPVFASVSHHSRGSRSLGDPSLPAHNALVWSRDAALAEHARLLETRVFRMLEKEMQKMSQTAVCSAGGFSVRFNHRASREQHATRQLAGWVVYSAPDEGLGEQLRGLLSSWLLSLLLCRKFAAVLWTGHEHAVDFLEVFEPGGNFGLPGLELAESLPNAAAEGRPKFETADVLPSVAQRPIVYVEGKELSKLEEKTVLSWRGACGCPSTGRHFTKQLARLQRESANVLVEVTTGCSFYRDLLPFLLPPDHKAALEQQATEAEFNTLGLLTALVLRPSAAMTALMPQWTREQWGVTERVVAVAVKAGSRRNVGLSPTALQCGMQLGERHQGPRRQQKLRTRYVVMDDGVSTSSIEITKPALRPVICLTTYYAAL